ncbi:hypothetical protein NDU88_007428 [Pleurodeles waltl]|uniref:Uncharacterized protein n=1 Tax=Pleurodeles waltl TaxID=8319 RepID=A0AAV7U1G8_PLEWA|nr:hypothetical protein NDU88_007428 [Pleurodeles waltl]
MTIRDARTATSGSAQSHAEKCRQPSFTESPAYSLCRVDVCSLLAREEMHCAPALTRCGRIPLLAPGLTCLVLSKCLVEAAVRVAVSMLGGVR